MRKLIFFIALLISTGKTYAQDSTKTLLHIPKINSIGIYAAPEYQFGQLKNELTPFAGMSGMLLFNKQFAIGAGFMQSVDRNFSPAGVSPLLLHSSFSGLKMEYTIHPNSAVHLSFPLLIGRGTARADSAIYHPGLVYDSLQHRERRMEPFNTNRSDYFIIQPGVEVEANLLSFVKLYVGANYRFSITDRSGMLPANTLQGASATIGLKAGLFNIPLRKKAR